MEFSTFEKSGSSGGLPLDERYIKGVDIKLSLPHQIDNDLENLLYRFKSNDMNLKEITVFHIFFERIHPFADGNGRVGRLLMAYQAIQNNMVPPLIENESRDEYLKAMNDKDALYRFLQESIDKSLELISHLDVWQIITETTKSIVETRDWQIKVILW